MGKRSRRRGDTPESADDAAGAAGPAAALDGAGSDGAASEAQHSDGTAPAERNDRKRGAPAPASGRPQGDLRLREAIELVEEADMLMHLYRWTVLCGDLPRPEDWLPHEDWPHPDGVQHVFGSWAKFIEHSGLRDAPPLLR